MRLRDCSELHEQSRSTSTSMSTVVVAKWNFRLKNAAPRRICDDHSGTKLELARGRCCHCCSSSTWPAAMEGLSEADPGMQLPPLAWKRRLDAPVTVLREFKPTSKEILEMLPMGVRLWKFCKSEHEQGRRAPIDPFYAQETPPSSCQGVPLGGIGGGSIGRGFRGDFCRWQLIPTITENAAVLADQFSVFVTRQRSDGSTQQRSSVLFSGKPAFKSKDSEAGISSWSWNLNGEKCTYYGLFPRAWTTYDGEPDPKLRITCRQVSPFIPHNYKESSFPSCVFVYELANTGNEDATVTLLLTWANSIGGKSEASEGHENYPFLEEDGVRGVILHHRTQKHYVKFAIAAREEDGVSVSACPSFLVSGAANESTLQTSKGMWDEIAERGYFDPTNWTLPSSSSQPGSVLGAAVAATVTVPARGTKSVTFGLAWDSPEAKFMSGSSYYRRYTKFYGKSGDAAPKLVHDAILNHQRWESEIDAWQEPVLKDDSLPEWYRYTLFNELYYMVAGGTIWTDRCIDQTTPTPKLNSANPDVVSKTLLAAINEHSETQSSWAFPLPANQDDVGQFLYLEGVEYLFWNTYDVHFYASYALLTLFPKLELQLQRDFAAATLRHDPDKMSYLAFGNSGIRTVFGAVPHDLGTHDPWVKLNSYNFYDTSRWKDLNCKFVVQVYRDAAASEDAAFARDLWPAVYAAMAYTEQFDRDGDGMIENDGVPDQTYDIWTVDGVSSYCGGLWLAALIAASALAEMVGDKGSSRMFHDKFLRARAVYETSLWNGSYFVYDKTSSSIQSDQIAGQWYARASGLPGVVHEAQARSALATVFEANVMQYKGGNEGAVNGMLPSGREDRTSLQSREVWAGTTYAVAAAMIQQGMQEEGFHTVRGVFLSGWSDQGYGLRCVRAMVDFSDGDCPVLLHRYSRECRLGGGGQGVVYKVSDKGDLENEEMYAAKMFKDRRYAQREARFMNRLRDCPGVAEFRSLLVEGQGGACWGTVVMKLYGPSLWDYTHGRNSQPVEKEVAGVVNKLAETLKLIHAEGVVHRDLKLENIFLELDARSASDVVIGDFGIATDNEAEMDHAIGTEEYMAPEVYANAIRLRPKKYTAAVDVWGLGVIAYMLLGAKTSMGSGVRDRGEFQWPADLSDEAKDLVAKMLERDPSKRCTLDDVLRHPWIVRYTHKTRAKRCGVKRSLPGLSTAEMGAQKKLAV